MLRFLLGGAHRLMKGFWFLRRPRTYGVHAVALTPRGAIVLVKLRYAPGWRLPGGGRGASEDPEEAVLRELSEEIGLISHGAVHLVGELEEAPDFKRDLASLFIVEDVVYRPKWSLEVEQVTEATIYALPKGLSARTRGWLDAAAPALERLSRPR